jgi:mono/diheme cytochrome c family protein
MSATHHYRSRTVRLRALLLVGLLLLAVVAVAGYTWVHHGFSARDRPSAIEVFVARRVRKLSAPSGAVTARNPVTLTPDVLADARAHFADHCAICHANDGSGETAIGRNLYPKAPDMRLPDTQSLTDGELFYIIHNGIRLTGMPAWGGDDERADEDSWKLAHFIRHLPHVTADEIREMESLNPKGPAEIEEERAEKEFLSGQSGSEKPDTGHDRMKMPATKGPTLR